MHVHDGQLMQALQPSGTGYGVLEVESSRVQRLADIDLAITGFNDFGSRIECLDICLDTSQRICIDTVDLIHNDHVCELDLVREEV